MDARTIDVYERGAGTFANDWHEQPAPSDLHRLVQKYLHETVIMHLPQNDVGPSARRLMSLLVPGGTLYLSWRVTERDTRDDAGRLYLAIEPETIIENLSPAIILLDEEVTSISSGKTIHHIIARK